jgi:amidophosphoribosyltransferase
MCCIVSIASITPVNQLIYDTLPMLQHRGQNAAGIIVTIVHQTGYFTQTEPGLVNDMFATRYMQRLHGKPKPD